jgi:hypothetical protein
VGEYFFPSFGCGFMNILREKEPDGGLATQSPQRQSAAEIMCCEKGAESWNERIGATAQAANSLSAEQPAVSHAIKFHAVYRNRLGGVSHCCGV